MLQKRLRCVRNRRDATRPKQTAKSKRLERRTYFERFDVEKSGHTVPERVCLLGPGVNAANEDAYKHITADFIVAINCALVVPNYMSINWPEGKKLSGWFIAEQDAGAVKWYQEWFKITDVTRYFSTNVCVHGVEIPPQWDKSVELHTYKLGGKSRFKYQDTPLGIAAAVMAFCGAKYIELCGFDISGNEYYTRKYREASFSSRYVHNLEQRLIKLMDSGIKIVSLNRIALQSIPEIKRVKTEYDHDNV